MRAALYGISLLALTTASGIAQAETYETDSKISKATLYTSQARVTRSASQAIEAGSHEVVLSGLPASLDPSSLRIEGSANAGTVSFGAIQNRLSSGRDLISEREKTLTEQLETLQDQRSALEIKNEALRTKISFFQNLGNKAIQATDEEISDFNLKPDQWVGSADALYEGIVNARLEVLVVEKEMRELDKSISAVRNELNTLRTGQKQTYEITIPVTASAAGTLNLELGYQLPNASWKPVYDAKLNSETGELSLIQYGDVKQRTGEDWDNVELTLSTAQPYRGTTLPKLSTQWLNSYDPEAAQTRMMKSSRMGGVAAAPQAMMAMDMAESDANYATEEIQMERVAMNEAAIETDGFVSEYVISSPQTIASDGSTTKVNIGTFDTASTIEIHVKPQITTEAFIVASATLEGDTPVLPGSVALFRDNNFVGNGYLPLMRGGDDTELAFGVDDQIKVERNLLTDETGDRGIVSQDQSIERNYKTVIQNLHSTPYKVVVDETIPVSRQEDVKVRILDRNTTKGYTESAENIQGLLRWENTLSPQQQWEVDLGWRITAPKDLVIQGY